ncbi:uncharacterized protein LOC126738183 [Anthonomus grandis grandis]|uniref:uncharacterized protein LOC126738183 n=1 Tax=Anthonomus grandis grandis TaxID=2921223 RepID=UPI002165B20D|nr:uncharacterized protein LOC126738183 [Anthonomus grandis grandis]
MAAYTTEEYADIVFAYGRANGNTREAQRIYEEQYPNRRVPHHDTFANTFRRLRETGNLNFQEPRTNRRQYDVAVDENVIRTFDEDPTTSTRKVATDLNISTWKAWSVVKAEGRHPFHYTPVQGLLQADYERRVQFCRFLLHADVENGHFLKSILWTDESTFTHAGIFNQHNLHYWENKNVNTHLTRAKSFQTRFSVWAGVIGRHLIGPHYLPRNLNGDNYLHFLQNDLPQLLADIRIFNEDGANRLPE